MLIFQSLEETQAASAEVASQQVSNDAVPSLSVSDTHADAIKQDLPAMHAADKKEAVLATDVIPGYYACIAEIASSNVNTNKETDARYSLKPFCFSSSFRPTLPKFVRPEDPERVADPRIHRYSGGTGFDDGLNFFVKSEPVEFDSAGVPTACPCISWDLEREGASVIVELPLCEVEKEGAFVIVELPLCEVPRPSGSNYVARVNYKVDVHSQSTAVVDARRDFEAENSSDNVVVNSSDEFIKSEPSNDILIKSVKPVINVQARHGMMPVFNMPMRSTAVPRVVKHERPSTDME